VAWFPAAICCSPATLVTRLALARYVLWFLCAISGTLDFSRLGLHANNSQSVQSHYVCGPHFGLKYLLTGGMIPPSEQLFETEMGVMAIRRSR